MTSVEAVPTTVPYETLSRHQRYGLIAWATFRTLSTVAVVVAIYYLVPLDKEMDASTVIELVIAALALAGVIAWQVWHISRSAYPTMRAVESFAFTIPVYVLSFAALYFVIDHANPASFGSRLTRTDTMYFSTTVLTTVGFGDISAKTQAARVLVTCQMMLDLLIVGLVVRLVVNAVKVGQRRRTQPPASG